MASAIFVVPVVDNNPVLDMADLEYRDRATGELGGGYACIGHVPQGKTCLVRVWTSAEQVAALAARTADGYLYVEVVR